MLIIFHWPKRYGRKNRSSLSRFVQPKAKCYSVYAEINAKNLQEMQS